jgi:hypothetical protein
VNGYRAISRDAFVWRRDETGNIAIYEGLGSKKIVLKKRDRTPIQAETADEMSVRVREDTQVIREMARCDWFLISANIGTSEERSANSTSPDSSSSNTQSEHRCISSADCLSVHEPSVSAVRLTQAVMHFNYSRY